MTRQPSRHMGRPSGRADLAIGRSVGRFQLVRPLGEGAQAVVWLAHDARLDRQVALKIHLNAAEGEGLQDWLCEARSVARLTHAHVVPVFEADLHEGRPYLVFEFVEGQTLAQARAGQGPMPARQAVMLMIGVLDALAAAHAQGIVHRDLKPSNLMLGADGRLRVMDFGIAVRGQTGDGFIAGTPGYMAPETLAGAAAHAGVDIYAAGVVLGEMLCGQRLRAPEGQALTLPEQARVDDALRALVDRALSAQPEQRPAGAAAMRDALAAWLAPQEPSDDEEGSATLQFLLRRMRHKSDFPALSAAVKRIQSLTHSESETLQGLTEAVLRDAALTHKLLRLVNTVHYQRSDGGIQSVSRAVALVGFAGVRNLALSLVLLEHMQNKAHADEIVQEFARGLMAASLAGELAAGTRAVEEVFVGAMFQNLGRLLVLFYLPEEATQLRQRMQADKLAEPLAAIAVLGVDLQTLGSGVARSWGLPETLLRCMRTPVGEPAQQAVPQAERPRWLARAANDLTDILLNCAPTEAPRALAQLSERHARALSLDVRHMMEATRTARQHMTELCKTLGLSIAADSPAQRLLAAPVAMAAADAGSVASLAPSSPAKPEASQVSSSPYEVTQVIDVCSRPATTSPATAGPAADAGAAAAAVATVAITTVSSAAAEALAQGIQELTSLLVADDMQLDAVLQRALTILQQALGLKRTLICLREPGRDELRGRHGVGPGAAALCRHFRILLAPGPQPDLFTTLCLRGADSAIDDARTGAVAARLPGWFREHVDAAAFLVLPLVSRGAPLGMIYGERVSAGSLNLGDKEWGLLRALRNQVLMALRQAA